MTKNITLHPSMAWWGTRVAPVMLAVALPLGCTPQQKAGPSARPPVAKTAPDDSWVALTGTVTATADDAFTLDYGEGSIAVEMDDWDWVPEGRHLLVNDKVVVYGFVDDDFMETRSIEASSVYVKDLGTQFYASGIDEEDFRSRPIVSFQPRIDLVGTVKAVKGSEFSLATGKGLIDVDTASLGYDPLDDEGYQKVEVGDRIHVVGVPGAELLADKDLRARSIVVLKKHAGKAKG